MQPCGHGSSGMGRRAGAKKNARTKSQSFPGSGGRSPRAVHLPARACSLSDQSSQPDLRCRTRQSNRRFEEKYCRPRTPKASKGAGSPHTPQRISVKGKGSECKISFLGRTGQLALARHRINLRRFQLPAEVQESTLGAAARVAWPQQGSPTSTCGLVEPAQMIPAPF